MKLIYIANARIPTEKAHGIQIMKMCEAFAKYGLPRIETTDDHGLDKYGLPRIETTDDHGLDKYGLPRIETTDDHGLLYKDITFKIRKAIFKVYNSLGNGHKETVYQRSLEEEFRKDGLKFETQKHLSVYYDGKRVGDYIPDFVVENKVIVELKACKFLTKNDYQQIFYYLRGSGYKLALLVNFGSSKLQIERLVWFPSRNYNQWKLSRKVYGMENQRESVVNYNQWKSEPIEVELIIPRRFNKIKTDPFEYYGIESFNHPRKSVVPNPRESESFNHPRKSVVPNLRESESFKITRLPCLDLIPLDFLLGNLALWIQTITFLISAKIYLLLKSVKIRGLTSVAIRKPYDILYTREQLVGLFFKDFVLEIHSLPSNIKTFHKKIWQKAKALIVLTSFIKKRLVEVGVKEDKILFVPNGIDLEQFKIQNSKFKIREKLGLPQDKKIIVYTGSFYFYDWKGIDILLEAVKYFEKDWVLVLVGGNKHEIEEIKRKYNLDKVLLIERKPHSDIPYYLKTADVLVIPNKKGDQFSEEYTSPLKLFEYMASGVPIVASDLPSIREILNENNAVLVEPNNAEVLARGIKKALQNNDLADRISKQAYQDVQEYTLQKRAENILEFIKNANN
jgi:GxxExxY protein